jgi:hypothetical protein
MAKKEQEAEYGIAVQELAEYDGGRQEVEDLTVEEIEAIVAATPVPDDDGANSKRKPFTDKLAGKTLEIVFDKGVDTPFSTPLTLTYEFVDAHQLRYSGTDGAGNVETGEASYEALEADETCIMVHHLRRNKHPLEAMTLFIDLKSTLVTAAHMRIGNRFTNRECTRKFMFGAFRAADGSLVEKRQGYTNYLVGKTTRWYYFADTPNMNHVFVSNRLHVSCIMMPPEAAGMGGAPATEYIKLNDTLYVFSWVEEKASGVTGIVCMDFSNASDNGRLHDCGVFFGINSSNSLQSFTYGGPGELAPMGVIREGYAED